jgi:hypothetical protein
MNGRRRFLKVVPAAVAGALAAPAIAQQQEQQQRITKETLDCGEKIFGIDFTDAEEQQALGGVNRNLEAFERLREMDIPLDTEPAVTFRPYLPGHKPKPGATPGAKIKVPLDAPSPKPASMEDLAFLPVTALAALIRKRDVSATDLTKMYLERLKKYGPKLLNVVTVTDELALSQAAQADREIRSGRYRGPLHGIPWVRKILATKESRRPGAACRIRYSTTTPSSQRLRDARAVLVAKLSMGALAHVVKDGRERRGIRSGAPAVIGGLARRPPAGRRRQSAETRGSISRYQPRTASSACDRPSARQPPRRDGAELDDGQDRAARADGGRLRAGL